MTTTDIAPGLRVTLSEGLSLETAKLAATTQRRIRGATPSVVPLPTPAVASANQEADRIAEAMAQQDLVLVGTIPLAPAPMPPGTTRAAVPGPQEAAVEVDLAPEEGAVVLLEQDGLYAWQFESETAPTTATPSETRRRGGSGTRTVTFRLPLGAAPAAGAKQRGWVGNLVIGRAQALVFKYAGRFLLSQGVAFLERKVRPGLVLMDTEDPLTWKPLADFAALPLPEDRPARILLFVHGTFSSTRGGFAGLCATDWGRAFLKAARAGYDAVVGFDHPTLSVDPLVNATALLSSLESRTWTQPATIDAISHSRGGITLRSLIEYLLPAANLPVRLERAIFVAAVNGGTELAEPKNWRAFINLYTNLAAAACRAIAMFPQTAFAGSLAAELFKSVGVLAKTLAEEAITESMIPGLAAMQPSGPFITALNQTQPGQPTAADSQYYAVTSDFRASLAINTIQELPRQLLLALADSTVDRIMSEANDLVVNTASMIRVDPDAGTFIKDTLAFGKNGVVYHTNYFLQPQVINALVRWLDLEMPTVANPATSRRVVRGGVPLPPAVPARLDTDVLMVEAEDSGVETRQRLQQRSPSYVVVERPWQGRLLHYAFPTEVVRSAIEAQPTLPIIQSLNLHETDASSEGQLSALPPTPGTGQPSARRVIALDGSRVVGVAEAEVVPTPLTDLVMQAGLLRGPQTDETRIIARRIMPSYVTPTPLEMAPKAPEPEPSSTRGGIPVTPIRRTRGQRSAPPAPPALPPPSAAPGPAAASPATPSSAAPPEKATGRFMAEMDDLVEVGATTTVDVTISREALRAARKVAVAGTASVSLGRKLIVEIIPKKNFVNVDEARAEVDFPEPGEIVQRVFEVKATDAGSGEILVRIRQGTQPLVNLVLQCTIETKRTLAPIRLPQSSVATEPTPGPEPLHQLTIMEIERGGQKLYHFTLDSPSLGLKDMYESKPLTGSREAYIKALYDDIEQRYLGNESDFATFQSELREVGAGLWDELFPEKLQAALWKWRDSIKSILVFSEEPFIPWELVHLKEPGKGLPEKVLFFGQMGLVRWLHNMGWPTTELRARNGRCLYVIPHYPHPDYALSGAEAEAEFLQKNFNATAVVPHNPPVRQLLGTPGGFDLLHFAGHGAADQQNITQAELLLEGRLEGSNYITEKLRASVVENLSGLSGPDESRPIVALNACQAGRAGYKLTTIGGFSRAFLKQGVGLFIGALWSVGDAPARVFTEELYARLLANETLAQATIAARNKAAEAKEATWLAYTVYGNPYAKLVP